jgi:hypothetical protein
VHQPLRGDFTFQDIAVLAAKVPDAQATPREQRGAQDTKMRGLDLARAHRQDADAPRDVGVVGA